MSLEKEFHRTTFKFSLHELQSLRKFKNRKQIHIDVQ